MLVYYHPEPLPKCKHCNVQLDFWIPGREDWDHECDECSVERMVNEIWNNALKKSGGWKEKDTSQTE